MINETQKQNNLENPRAVTDGVEGTIHSRLMAAVAVHPGADVAGANTNGRTWTEAEGVRKIFVTVNGSGAVSDTQDYCDIVLDAPNGATAKTFLDATAAGNLVGAAFVTLRVPMNKRVELPLAPYSSPFRRIDVKPTQAANVLVEAY